MADATDRHQRVADMTLHADITLRRGSLRIDASFGVEAGQVLALLGPNGAGKSSILRAVAGLLPIDQGTIRLHGRIIDEAPNGVFVPPESRDIAMVFQDYLLFEHMNVVDNVAFGLRTRGSSKADARSTAMEALGTFGLVDAARRPVTALSGGQAQRVALARALVTSPRALLLDEPLAALDVNTRSEVRRDLKRFLGGFDGPTILVTHDPVDAFTLADRIAIIEDGSIVQVGTMTEVTQRPRSRYVAGLVGINLLKGRVDQAAFTTDDGALIVGVDTAPGAAFAIIRPRSVTVSTRAPESSSARNVWHGRVSDVNHMGDRVRLSIADPLALTAEITSAAFAELQLRLDAEVYMSVKATEVEIVPA